MSKPVNCVSKRLGIKSSLPKYLSTLITSYVLWKIKGMTSSITYGGSFLDDKGVKKIKFTQDEENKINTYFGENFTQHEFAENPLISAQVEHLDVGLLNFFKIGYIRPHEGISVGVDRKGGKRVLRVIYFSGMIDLLNEYVIQDEETFKEYGKKILSEDVSDPCPDFLKTFIAVLGDITVHNDKDKKEHLLISDQIGLSVPYKYHENGPSRIIKKYLKDDEHPFIDKKFKDRSGTDSVEFKKRMLLLSKIISINYCNALNENGKLRRKFRKPPGDKTENKLRDNVPKNLLLKGVPGTGKSRAIDEIIKTKLLVGDDVLPPEVTQKLRINIHSSSNNSDLMQGIGVYTNDENHIEYKEKRGLVLDFLFKSISNPSYPFILVLEEVQENSLNQLIGDLIYLIDKDKRAKGLEKISLDKDKEYDLYQMVDEILKQRTDLDSVSLPNLIESREVNTTLIFPDNLYVFCTSNYRDDKKVIEDNLLRRFDVIEIYPDETCISDKDVKDFFKSMNESILEQFKDIEVHPDRFLIGHANWMNIKKSTSSDPSDPSDPSDDIYVSDIAKALLKVVIEFKEIKEVEYGQFKSIFENIVFLPEVTKSIKDNDSYKDVIKDLQEKCGYSDLTK